MHDSIRNLREVPSNVIRFVFTQIHARVVLDSPELSLQPPQKKTVPCSVRAAECESPAEICTILGVPSGKVTTSPGTAHSSSSDNAVPSSASRPKLPSSLQPHENTRPAFDKATVCMPPAQICDTMGRERMERWTNTQFMKTL